MHLHISATTKLVLKFYFIFIKLQLDLKCN